MAEYIGKRVVPRHDGEWNSTLSYEGLVIVLDPNTGDSYTSRKAVPAGIPLTNTEYWARSGVFNAQLKETYDGIVADNNATENAIKTDNDATEKAIKADNDATENAIKADNDATEAAVKEDNAATKQHVNDSVAHMEKIVETARQEYKSGNAAFQETAENLNTRMDSIVGGATTDTEILDARVDYAGSSHENLGAHIRSITERKLDCAYDATGEVTKGITVNTNTGQTQDFENAYTTGLIPIDRKYQRVYYTGRVFNWIGVAGYDRDGEFVCSILDLTEDGSSEKYTGRMLTIPEGVAQIRASSYNESGLSIKIVAEPIPFWEQAVDSQHRIEGAEEDIAALYNADINLVEEALNLWEFTLRYSDSYGWTTSSPYLDLFYVPITIIKDVYIESIRWRQTFIGDTSVTVTLELGGKVVYSETADATEGAEIEVGITPKRVFTAGAYIMRLKATETVMCYPTRNPDAGFISNDYVSNEPSGNVTFSHSNERIVFQGIVAVRTGGVDGTLSIAGMPADAVAAGKALGAKLDKVMGRNLLDPASYRPGWFAYKGSGSVTFHEDNLRYGSSGYLPVSKAGLVTSGSGINGVTSQIVYDANHNVLRYVDGNDQYTYEEGDAYVVFCYHASSGENLCVLEGTEYFFEEYTDYLPLTGLEGRVEELEGKASLADVKLGSLYESDSYLIENALPLETVPMLYPSNNIWTNSSPLLADYWNPLTVLKGVYIESISWTQRFYGTDSMAVTLEDADGNILYSETVPVDVAVDDETAYGDLEITVTPKMFVPAGSYRIRYRTVGKVQCYTSKADSAEYLTNEYFCGEASGGITYLYNNNVLVFKGTIQVRAASEEVLDARTDYDGNTYGSLGEHIRTVTQKKMDKAYNATGEITAGISVNTENGKIVNFSAGYTTGLIPVDRETQKVYYTGRVFNWVGVAGYDREGNFVCPILDTVDSGTAVVYENEELDIPEGIYQIRASSYTYSPVIIIEGTAAALWNTALESQMRLDMLSGENKVEIGLSMPMPIYTVCNDLNTGRNYYASIWIDHLIQKRGWKDIGSGFGKEMDQHFNLYSPFSTDGTNGGEDVLEQTVTREFHSEGFQTREIAFTHRSTLASMGRSEFPKILTIGDSVTVGYLANANKSDSSLPNPYWAWVKYLFELDRADAGGSDGDFNCLMVGVPSIGGISYGTSSAFTLNGTRFNNYAVGKGGWSAEDLDLETFESDTNRNPFYDADTGAFSLKTFLDNFRTLADDGVTRLVPGETAGTMVTDTSAYDLCTPTHVVINLNHNSSLAEYQKTIPAIVGTIKAEYPDMIVILMSIDETGTYFPAKYPQYAADDITIGTLHEKNVSIYEYFCEELQDESRGIYVCSGHLVQPPVESYPCFVYISADSAGRDAEHTLGRFHGFGKGYGGPNWHPNNYAHAAWGYQLYALIKYTLALKGME